MKYEYFSSWNLSSRSVPYSAKETMLNYHLRKTFSRTKLFSAHLSLFFINCNNLILTLSDYSIIILWEAGKSAWGPSACVSGPVANPGCWVMRKGMSWTCSWWLRGHLRRCQMWETVFKEKCWKEVLWTQLEACKIYTILAVAHRRWMIQILCTAISLCLKQSSYCDCCGHSSYFLTLLSIRNFNLCRFLLLCYTDICIRDDAENRMSRKMKISRWKITVIYT